jgi:hypothetical protein
MNSLFRVNSSEHQGREKVEWKVETVQVEFMCCSVKEEDNVAPWAQYVSVSGSQVLHLRASFFLSPLYTFHPSCLADAPSF